MKRHALTAISMLMVVFAALFVAARPARAEGTGLLGEAFGAAAGLALYDAQVIIGMTADASMKDVYTTEESNAVIAEQKNALDVIDGYTEKLLQLETTLNEDDRKALADVSSCIEKIHATADALTVYISEPTADNANYFEEKRLASYDALSDLLGLEN